MHSDKHESFLQIHTMIFDGDDQASLEFPKDVRDEVDFLHADKHQSFLQVDFNTLVFTVFYKVILSFLMGMIKHFQSTQSKILGRVA